MPDTFILDHSAYYYPTVGKNTDFSVTLNIFA